ncbi:hypothetical protein HZS_7388 [Henneguya salminicola]|nr:hypothetical protein HZS_7388 [Henneguya salminicola]
MPKMNRLEFHKFCSSGCAPGCYESSKNSFKEKGQMEQIMKSFDYFEDNFIEILDKTTYL